MSERQSPLLFFAFLFSSKFGCHLHYRCSRFKFALNAMLSVVYIDVTRVVLDFRLAFANANHPQGCLSHSPNASQYDPSSCFSNLSSELYNPDHGSSIA
ncbi:hypothetical protein C7974DRAFT_3240 [Boeremia exigua]|uniref:uncharacterized protein n=1 Tax=Boeremia exigua TaxID=749465 RepID=UPI001E8D0B03|nr:uncharacterized protein C7974DRAFT_3240 [Boeremia exigua]KAH6643689.1 hypothetical protein C7974DRAFT_3240 [Boeremia exigua]